MSRLNYDKREYDNRYVLVEKHPIISRLKLNNELSFPVSRRSGVTCKIDVLIAESNAISRRSGCVSFSPLSGPSSVNILAEYTLPMIVRLSTCICP